MNDYNSLYPRPISREDYTKEKTYKYTIPPVEVAMTIIPDAYTSPEFYAFEQERVFATSWVPVGYISEVKRPGDVIVVNVAGQSIIVKRDKKGKFSAFYKVCCHRGAKLLDND